MGNRNENIIRNAAFNGILVLYFFYYLIERIFKCRHKKSLETWLAPYESQMGPKDLWMNQYQIVTRCKKCNKLLHTINISKDDYIKHQRELKFNRILNEK
jgi:hypothetical protein